MIDEPQLPQRRSIHRGDLIAALSALLLLAAMLLMDWYGVVTVPTRSTSQSHISTAVNAWQALSTLRWLMVLTIVVALGALALHASQRRHGTPSDTGPLVTALGGLTLLLLVYRVLISFPRPDEMVDQKLGALLGLLFALGITLGGYEAMRAERAYARLLVQRSRRRVASRRPAR